MVVPENVPIGKELARFVAREADDKRTKNSEVFYSLVGGDSELFWINSTTGKNDDDDDYLRQFYCYY